MPGLEAAPLPESLTHWQPRVALSAPADGAQWQGAGHEETVLEKGRECINFHMTPGMPKP